MHKFSDWTFSLELKGLLYREPRPLYALSTACCVWSCVFSRVSSVTSLVVILEHVYRLRLHRAISSPLPRLYELVVNIPPYRVPDVYELAGSDTVQHIAIRYPQHPTNVTAGIQPGSSVITSSCIIVRCHGGTAICVSAWSEQGRGNGRPLCGQHAWCLFFGLVGEASGSHLWLLVVMTSPPVLCSSSFAFPLLRGGKLTNTIFPFGVNNVSLCNCLCVK
ncbi:hypothetical protein GDO78_011373 [Eleutherodactylus coqui]|uniref:Uncharacterized protein n=1 Tax=Eleutherodactylus coqui TaxID=57060 RepID=A0A8J6F9D6_ELECQ|nr:hypothetical protein GDO78_011373 [Eleutherodactylus coqui]